MKTIATIGLLVLLMFLVGCSEEKVEPETDVFAPIKMIDEAINE